MAQLYTEQDTKRQEKHNSNTECVQDTIYGSKTPFIATISSKKLKIKKTGSNHSEKLESSLLKSELSQGDPLSLLSYNTVWGEEDNTNQKLNKRNNIGKEKKTYL